MISSELSQNPEAKMVYRAGIPNNTHIIFKNFLKNSREPCFIHSKYNLALKIKM